MTFWLSLSHQHPLTSTFLWWRTYILCTMAQWGSVRGKIKQCVCVCVCGQACVWVSKRRSGQPVRVTARSHVLFCFMLRTRLPLTVRASPLKYLQRLLSSSHPASAASLDVHTHVECSTLHLVRSFTNTKHGLVQLSTTNSWWTHNQRPGQMQQ